MTEGSRLVASVLAEPFVYPPDVMAALQAKEAAWRNFQTYSAPSNASRSCDNARKHLADFEKRLHHLIQKTEKNKQFGYGIEDYYG